MLVTVDFVMQWLNADLDLLRNKSYPWTLRDKYTPASSTHYHNIYQIFNIKSVTRGARIIIYIIIYTKETVLMYI